MELRVIREAEGNLLAADVDALVNTVNTVGVMGKGIALQFKRAYPRMFSSYQRAAKAGELRTGQMQVWETGALNGPRFVINFPTKRHWRGPSTMDYVRDGLDDLARVISERSIRSVAVPPLGCGNGGLDWPSVRRLIEEKLGPLSVDVVVFPPAGAPEAQDMIDRRALPAMTRHRALLLRIMSEYQRRTLEAPSVIETQKLMYFLQVAGQPLGLSFARGYYGPYADRLRQVLSDLEGHFIIGFGDGTAKVNDAEPLRLLPPGWDAASNVDLDAATGERIARVLDLVDGFGTPYGLELLASVHWVVGESPELDDPDEVLDAVQAWNPRKRRLFGRDHLRMALNTLRDRGWLDDQRVAVTQA